MLERGAGRGATHDVAVDDAESDALPTRRSARGVHRLRLAAICLGLALLTFSQSAGAGAADTKLDLAVTPLRFLRNALQMWVPTSGAGQTQDQAYGYLFPMGPFYVLGKWSALPPWVVQRSWESLLVIVAFLGAVRLARLLRVPGTWPRVAVGLAYALSPRILTELGVISSELLPDVVLPWIMVPLVRGARVGSPRRAAARSGVALLFAGGINATATLAVLPMPLLFLLTRRGGPRRRSLLGWWIVAVVLSCLWWALPLIALGKYSPPFLDWIESSAVTTFPTDLADMLRGTDHWESLLGPSAWPIGWAFIAASGVVFALGVVTAAGIGGLARCRIPERSFLLVTVVVGALLLSMGHVSTVGPVFAGPLRTLLDGSLNAFRNVHKFDALIRLPLALGVGHTAAALAERIRARPTLVVPRGGRLTTRFVAAGAVLVVAVVAVLPALTGRVVSQTRAINDPSWWSHTAAWLGTHAHGGRALVVPGAAAPAYVWGEPRDDALQPYADSPWTVRDVAPIAQPGYVRLLDAIEADLAGGRGDPALPAVLARSGIRYVVVRNDLDTQKSEATPLRFVHAAVDNTPGLTKVAQFGPDLSPKDDPNRLVDLGLTRAQGAVDVYANTAWTGRAALDATAGAVVANGSGDEILPLSQGGLPASTPVLFGRVPKAVRAAASTTAVLTDGIRRREFGFGSIDKYSQTLTPTAAFHNARAAHDYLPDDAGTLSTVAYNGISDVTASSTAADPTSPAYLGPQYAPWAALDADTASAWRSSTYGGGVGQWLQVDLAHAVTAATVGVAFAGDTGTVPTRVRISTDAGSRDEDVSPDTRRQQLRLPAGPTQRLRIAVLGVRRSDVGKQVGIATLTIPGVVPARVLNVVGPSAPDAIAFAAESGRRPACLTVNLTAAACERGWARSGEEDDALVRGFSLDRAASYSAVARFVLRPGPALDALLDAGNPIRAAASSTDAPDPRERPGAAVDGDDRTGWVAAQGDRNPALTLQLPTVRPLTGLVVHPLVGAPVTRARSVRIDVGGRTFAARVPADGAIHFPAAVRADRITITVTTATLRASTDSLTNQAHLLPVGIGDVRLLGSDVPVGRASATVGIGCLGGLQLGVDGRETALQVNGPAAQVLAGAPVAATPCGTSGVPLSTGRHEVALGASPLALPQALDLRRQGTAPAPAAAEPGARLRIGKWGRTDRTVRVDTTRASLLVVHENLNAGWRATLHGRTLHPVMVDGWQQGWALPAGAHGVAVLRYTPQRSVDVGLIVGAVAVLALAVLALLRPRRPVRAAALAGWRLGPVGAGVACVAAGLLLGGVAGLVVGVVALGARIVLARGGRRLPVVPVVAGALLLVAALSALHPAGSADPFTSSWLSQVLCLVALCVALVEPASGSRAPGTTGVP